MNKNSTTGESSYSSNRCPADRWNAVSSGTTWKRNARMKAEGYMKVSKALLISQNRVAKVMEKFNKDGTAAISQSHPGHPWNTLTQASCDEKGCRKAPCKFSAVSQRCRKPNWGDRFPWHNTAYTAEERRAWVSSMKEASPKVHVRKKAS